jgi:hypothetical protein
MLGHEPAAAAQAATPSLQTQSEPAHSVALSQPVDHAPVATEAAEPAAPAAAAPAFSGFGGGDAGQLMDALLIAAAAAPKVVVAAAQHTQDLAAVQEAFADAHGEAAVDAVVAAFAPAGGPEPVATAADAGALVSLFAVGVAGSHGFNAPVFDMNTMLHDLNAAGAVQA